MSKFVAARLKIGQAKKNSPWAYYQSTIKLVMDMPPITDISKISTRISECDQPLTAQD